MSSRQFKKPRLPSHYYVRYEPPDSAGNEVLHFISDCRRVKVKGHSFREFLQQVVPLLDGTRTLEEIQTRVNDLFTLPDLEACLQLLAEQNLLEEGASPLLTPELEARMKPQLNFFHDVSPDPQDLQRQLGRATVSVVGLGGAGASVALSLAAAGVGTIRCIDHLSVTPADCYWASAYGVEDGGNPRVEVVRKRMNAIAPEVQVVVHKEPLETDADVAAEIRGSEFAVCCVDPGQSSVIYKLNRVCLQTGTRWISWEASGTELTVGPTVHPFETSCYLCYKMRAVACASNPEDEFAYQRLLDQRKRDDSDKRGSLVFAAGIAGHLLALETLKELTGFAKPSLAGRVAVINLMDLGLKKHVVLRKPWCPACFEGPPTAKREVDAPKSAVEETHEPASAFGSS